MENHWAHYRIKIWRFGRYLLLAPLVALLPFFIQHQFEPQESHFWSGLAAALLAGLVIGLTIGALFASVYAALTWIAGRTGRFYQPPVLAHILLGALGATLGILILNFFRSPSPDLSASRGAIVFTIIFTGVIATAFGLFFAYLQAKEESLALRAESAEARYFTLEHQMRPHFLFNALNSLAELIESGQENAAQMTIQLSELYRRILQNSGLKTAPLDSEVEIARSYLTLEQLRFGHRLDFTISTPHDADRIFLPSLILQTLVENAVKHGVAPSMAGGQISIEVSKVPSPPNPLSFRARVSNTGARYQTHNNKLGTGLENTQNRLNLLFGERHQFRIASTQSGVTEAEFYFSGERIE